MGENVISLPSLVNYATADMAETCGLGVDPLALSGGKRTPPPFELLLSSLS